jgi:hypothetical protein
MKGGGEMEVMLQISLNKDSYLARIKQANDEINKHYTSMREIAERLRYLTDYMSCETAVSPQNSESVCERIFLEVNEDSLLADIGKAEKEMASHFRAIEEIIDDLSTFRDLKRYVKENAVSE